MAGSTTVADKIAKIKSDRNIIRTAMLGMGLANSTDNLGALATKIAAVNVFKDTEYDVKQGESFTIPKGYHNGSTKVLGLDNEADDASKYKLTSVSGIVAKEGEEVTVSTPQGFYGMSSVTVDPIPNNYKDVSSVTAEQADVPSTKLFVTNQGELKYGTMDNIGAVSKTLDKSLNGQGQYSNNEYTVPKGYHNGNGKVKIEFEAKKVVTPDDNSHTIIPGVGKVLSTVYVEPIPSRYVADKTPGTATAGDILNGKTAYVNGNEVTGNIPVRTAFVDAVVNGLNFSAPAGYYAEDINEVAIDNNLVAANIKSGTSIFGVAGTFTSDGTVSASHIMKDYVAYSKGEKVVGTMPTFGSIENTIEWTDLSKSPYFSTVLQGYVSGIDIGIDVSTLETALSEI